MPHASLHDDSQRSIEALVDEWSELDARIASLDRDGLSERRRLLLGLRREEAAVAQCVAQIAVALKSMAKRGVVHRDLRMECIQCKFSSSGGT